MQHDIIATLNPKFSPTDSIHEKKIKKHFGRKLLRQWTDQERKLLGAKDLYFVVFTNRSGSTYLTEIMHLMGAGVHPRAELFNGHKVIAMAKKMDCPTFSDYLLAIVERDCQAGRVGFKISTQQLFWLTKLGLLDVFGSVSIVNSLREDLLGQAVSLHKARTTGQWHTLMPSVGKASVSYSRKKILLCLQAISHAREQLNYYCALHHPARIDVSYEELLANPIGEMERLARFLEMEEFEAGQVDLGSVGIKQQRNEESESLKRAFMEEFYMQVPDEV